MDERDQLIAKKQQLEQLIANKRETFAIPLSESTDELSMYDQHPADNATDLYEREKDTGILELLDFELEKVNDALARLNSGLYGVCQLCGQPIEEKRLSSLVNTTLCAACAHKEQYHYTKQEPAISPGLMSDMGETFQVAGYELYEE